MTVPNPLAARPQQVYVALVPGLEPDPESNFTVLSGFTSDEDIALHRLSKKVLQLAMVNCFVSVTIRLIGLMLAIVYDSKSQLLSFVINVTFSIVLMYLGIRGVKTRNAPCCPCCCGTLTAFYVVYIILAVIESFAILVSIIDGFIILVLLDMFVLILYSVTAEYARRLLETLTLLPDEDSSFTHAAIQQQLGDTPQLSVVPSEESTRDTTTSSSLTPSPDKLSSRGGEDDGAREHPRRNSRSSDDRRVAPRRSNSSSVGVENV